MSEDGSTRARLLGYEIQHIFVREIATNPDAQDAFVLLQPIGFNLESRSNKIALLRDPATRDAIANAPPEVRAALAAAGFGENIHDSRASGGNHPEYNAFQIEALSELARRADREGWSQETKTRAVFDLHRFVAGFNIDGSIAIIGTAQATFAQAWAVRSAGKDYANLSLPQAASIDAYFGFYVATPIDVNSNGESTGNNSKLRYVIAEALNRLTIGILTPQEQDNAFGNLERANPNGTNSGNASASVSSIIHDLQRRSSTPVLSTQVTAENLAAKLFANAPDAIDLDVLTNTLSDVFETIVSSAESLPETIADDARNADSFWFAPDVTIMDAQASDRLRFFGLTLTGGDTTLTAAALAVGALSNPLFGAGVAGAAAAVNLNRFVSGEPLVYFDRFVPWITYTLVDGAAPGTQDLIVGNVFDALGRYLIDAPSIYETDNGDGSTTNYAGTLRVRRAANDDESDACTLGFRCTGCVGGESKWGVAA